MLQTLVCLFIMSQLVNPIQGKLSKMRNSQMLRLNTHSDSTPLKTQEWIDNDKQNNISLCPLTQHSKHLNKKQSESSVRKLNMLERRSSQKHQSNSFLKNELSRRRKKYQDQLIQSQEKYQKLVSNLQQQLINQMKIQQQLDQQSDYLKQIFQNIGEFSILDKLDNQTLRQFEKKLGQLGLKGHDLLYSVETVMESKKLSPIVIQNKSSRKSWGPKTCILAKNSVFEDKDDAQFGNISIQNSKYFLKETNVTDLQKYWTRNDKNI